MKFLIHVRVAYSYDGVPQIYLFVVVNSVSYARAKNFVRDIPEGVTSSK